MKKLLSLLGSLSLTAVAAISVVSCTTGEKYTAISTLKEQNLYLWDSLTDGSVGTVGDSKMFSDIKDGKDLLFTDGLTNKHVTNKSLKGTFNADEPAFVTTMNKKYLNNELKIDLPKKAVDDAAMGTYSSYGEISSKLLESTTINIEKLKGIKISGWTAGYKFDGDTSNKAVTSKAAREKFDKILNLEKDSAAESLDSFSNDLINGTYWIGVTFNNEVAPSENIDNEVWNKQVLRITNRNAIYNPETKEFRLRDTLLHSIDDNFKFLNDDSWNFKAIKEDLLGKNNKDENPKDFIDSLILKNVDLFKVGYQKFDNSIELNCNSINDQASSYISSKKYIDDISNAINAYNQKVVKEKITSSTQGTLGDALKDSDLILGATLSKGEGNIVSALHSKDWLANTFKINKKDDWENLKKKKIAKVEGPTLVNYLDEDGKEVKGPETKYSSESDKNAVSRIADNIRNEYFKDTNNNIIYKYENTEVIFDDDNDQVIMSFKTPINN